MELYWSPADYNKIIDLCENIIKKTVFYIHQTYKINYKGIELDFEKPFTKIDFLDHLTLKTGFDFKNTDLENKDIIKDLIDIMNKYNIKYTPPLTIPRILDKLAGHFIEIECDQPTFIIHHPKIMSPLAKPHRENNKITERFELFICKHEYANAYTELNDPIIQKNAFIKQLEDKNNGDIEAQPTDFDFVTALEYGLPPTGGLGIGIDRLVMLLTNQDSIREIITFPTMK